VRGQRSTCARRWVPYNGRCRPVRGMQTTDLSVFYGGDVRVESTILSGRDAAPAPPRSRGTGSDGVRRRERLDCPAVVVTLLSKV
jgi:hypothetical protein